MIPTLQLGGAGRARYHAPAGGGSDPYFANVELLLHMDGSDNGTTFTDVTGRTISRLNAVTKTGEKKFGTASAYFDGTGDLIYTPYTADLRWWDADYTVEAWVFPISTLDLQADANIPGMLGNCTSGATEAYWAFGPMNNRALQFFYWVGAVRTVSSTELVTADAWNHVAMTHKLGSGIKLWVNGVGTSSYTAISGTPQDNTARNLIIGSCFGGDIKAYVDDVRITRGVERYTADFTPPTAAFPDS